jgi:hypothetical protein
MSRDDVEEARGIWERALEELARVDDDAGRVAAEARAAEALEELGEAIERAARERVPVAPAPDVLPDMAPLTRVVGPVARRNVPELRVPVGPTHITKSDLLADLLEPVSPVVVTDVPHASTP